MKASDFNNKHKNVTSAVKMKPFGMVLQINSEFIIYCLKESYSSL